MKSKLYIKRNLYDNKSQFELVWSIIVSFLSTMIGIFCFIVSMDEWFLLLGSLSGSAFIALLKV